MKLIQIISMLMLSSCGAIPQLLTTAEHVADDTAVKHCVSIEALQKGTNIRSTIEVCNSADDFPPR